MVDINLTGILYFARLSLAYLKHKNNPTHHSNPSTQSPSKSITFIASSAGFKGFPGLFAYSASKHGVLGLMRALRPHTPSVFSVRVNAICPSLTNTRMMRGLNAESVRDNNIHMNTPEEVAKVIVQVAADGKAHGKAVYVAGGRAFNVEEGIERLDGEWLGGEEWVEDLRRTQVLIGAVSVAFFFFSFLIFSFLYKVSLEIDVLYVCILTYISGLRMGKRKSDYLRSGSPKANCWCPRKWDFRTLFLIFCLLNEYTSTEQFQKGTLGVLSRLSKSMNVCKYV